MGGFFIEPYLTYEFYLTPLLRHYRFLQEYRAMHHVYLFHQHHIAKKQKYQRCKIDFATRAEHTDYGL